MTNRPQTQARPTSLPGWCRHRLAARRHPRAGPSMLVQSSPRARRERTRGWQEGRPQMHRRQRQSRPRRYWPHSVDCLSTAGSHCKTRCWWCCSQQVAEPRKHRSCKQIPSILASCSWPYLPRHSGRSQQSAHIRDSLIRFPGLPDLRQSGMTLVSSRTSPCRRSFQTVGSPIPLA